VTKQTKRQNWECRCCAEFNRFCRWNRDVGLCTAINSKHCGHVLHETHTICSCYITEPDKARLCTH